MAATIRGVIAWRKSTYSGTNGGDCVEVGRSHVNVLVRDTKHRNGAVLDVNLAEWRRFTATLKH